MNSADLWFDALGQFVGGRGGPGNELVRFGIAAIIWGGLFLVAWTRRALADSERERLLLWGFGFGFAREAFMFCAFLADYFQSQPKPWHLVFPPIDHALTTASVVLVAAAFIQFLVRDAALARRYLYIGLAAVGICYLSTFAWWANYISLHPESRFGQTWCDWMFRGTGCLLSAGAILLLLRRRGWLRNLVVVAMLLFFADDALKLVDMALGEVYEPYFSPPRHAMHILAVLLFGVVYVRELLFERSLLTAAIQHAGDSILLLDRDRNIQYVNPTFCRYTGFEPGEVIGKAFDEVLRVPRHGPRFYERFWSVLEKGQSWHGRMYTPRKEGGDFEGERHVAPLRDKKGEIESYVSVNRDLSEQRVLERRLLQSQKMEAIGTLAGGIAHDFNNLLTPIMGYTEVTRERMEAGNPLRKNLDQVLLAAERAREMIGQILTISRQSEREKRPVELLPLVKQTLKLLRGSLPTTIEIRQHLPVRHSLVQADPSQINQVLINLATNAAQAMEENGGLLEIGLEEVVVDDQFASRHVGLATGIYLCLSVCDNGPGIPVDVEERMFEPFFTTKQERQGTGLGLAIVQGVVQDHDGAIEVESVPGQGTLFRVFLPLVPGRATPEMVPARVDLVGNERILLVDDEATIVSLGCQMLEDYGYTVTGRMSSNEALDTLRKAPGDYDLLVTDLTMPEMTGMELAREARSLVDGLPVILCTGFFKEELRQQAIDAGIRIVLPKPYTISELNETIRRIFD